MSISLILFTTPLIVLLLWHIVDSRRELQEFDRKWANYFAKKVGA